MLLYTCKLDFKTTNLIVSSWSKIRKILRPSTNAKIQYNTTRTTLWWIEKTRTSTIHTILNTEILKRETRNPSQNPGMNSVVPDGRMVDRSCSTSGYRRVSHKKKSGYNRVRELR